MSTSRYDMNKSCSGIPNFQLNIVEMCLCVVLQVPICSIAVFNLYLVHPSLSNISLNISSVWSKLSSPLIYKSALQHPYLPILPIIPKALSHLFQAPLKGWPLEMLGDVLLALSIQTRHCRWFIIDVLTLGPDWALEIVAWSSPGDLAECLGPPLMDGCFVGDSLNGLRFWWFFVKNTWLGVGEGL